MSVLSLANTLGAATGSLLPSTLVPDSDTVNHADLNKGISNLMLVQLCVPGISLVLCYFYFLNQPRNPPSALAIAYANPNAAVSAAANSDANSPLVAGHGGSKTEVREWSLSLEGGCISILLVSYSMLSDALQSPYPLLSYSIIFYNNT